MKSIGLTLLFLATVFFSSCQKQVIEPAVSNTIKTEELKSNDNQEAEISEYAKELMPDSYNWLKEDTPLIDTTHYQLWEEWQYKLYPFKLYSPFLESDLEEE